MNKHIKNENTKLELASPKATATASYFDPADDRLHRIRRTILRKLTLRLTSENYCCQ